MMLFTTSLPEYQPESFAGLSFPKAFVDMQRQEKQTHLPPALSGALTLVSRSKTEAAGATMRAGGVKIEGTRLAGITLDASNISLQTWQQL